MVPPVVDEDQVDIRQSPVVANPGFVKPDRIHNSYSCPEPQREGIQTYVVAPASISSHIPYVFSVTKGARLFRVAQAIIGYDRIFKMLKDFFVVYDE